MEIIERQVDLAGKYRVLVGVDNTRAIPLKFQEKISDEIVFKEAQRIIDFEEQQRVDLENLQLLEKELKDLEDGNN